MEFTGKERDSESGLDYFGARYYGSTIGRFSSPDPSGLVLADPANPQSLNLYTYVANNPLRFIDPTGLSLYANCTEVQEGDGSGGDFSVTVTDSKNCTLEDDGHDPHVSGNIRPLNVPQYNFSGRAPSNQIQPCFVKGAGTGLVTGLAVAGGTALAATVLAPEVVTGALLAAGAYGGYSLYQSIKADLGSGNNAGLAYSAGAFLGGAAAGGATSFGVRASITGETAGPSGLFDFSGLGKLTNPFRAGNSVFGNIRASFAKGPDLLGGGAAIVGAGAGIPRKGC